jgi:hypothetical protein
MLAPLLAVAIGCSGDSDGNVIGPPTLRVGTSGTASCASIQRAVDAAPSGATILVEPGVFTESVEISRALTITGSGPGTVVEFPADAPADSAVITARDLGGLRIEALSVRASRPDVDGIRVRNASTSNIGWGIAIMESPDTVLDRNTAAGNGAGDLKCKPDPCPEAAFPSRRAGLTVRSGVDCPIRACSVRRCFTTIANSISSRGCRASRDEASA